MESWSSISYCISFCLHLLNNKDSDFDLSEELSNVDSVSDDQDDSDFGEAEVKKKAGTMTSPSANLGTLTYRVSPGLALVGLKVMRFTVRSAFMALRTFSECEGSRLGGTAMVYNVFSKLICILLMAEGGYDPRDETTDKDPLIPGTGDDDDDDDDDPWKNIDWEAPIDLDPEDLEPEPEKRNPFEPARFPLLSPLSLIQVTQMPVTC